MNKNIKVIAFDADDTLWDNEIYFREAEHEFATLLEPYTHNRNIVEALFKTELQNLPIYGYGIKGFTLSMIETATELTHGDLPPALTKQILELGKSMLNRPVTVLEGVESVLQQLRQQDYKLMVATKGDLLDQQRKVQQSQLKSYFHHVEVMSDKKEDNYQLILHQHTIAAGEFLMIGNSLKSDVLPVLNIGGHAAHIPYSITWMHEHVDQLPVNPNFRSLKHISEVMDIMGLK
ncbi:HAD family hydrolase [Chitinophaga caeni]|uniref:HAD family hydrolase n=1 Tax=Chitinophaga caeni TaxID=2029983 RepID=A0A291QWT4_9BACT|nr:HAD family hydrolase [Chitinophaga caeni]ATL48489.1 HAD family hydrolase [Chitinophaga caeni]